MWMFRGYNIPNYLLKSTLPPLLSTLATTGVQQRSRVVSINFCKLVRATRKEGQSSSKIVGVRSLLAIGGEDGPRPSCRPVEEVVQEVLLETTPASSRRSVERVLYSRCCWKRR
jgi:hypothetical protein